MFFFSRKNVAVTERGFTLIELLVVIAIITLLVTIMLPSLAKAKELARQATCLMNVSGQIKAVHMYAAEEDNRFPVGPESLLYGIIPYQKMMSNQIWLSSQEYSAHGALLDRDYVDPGIFFCPSDGSGNIEGQLEVVRNREAKDAYCSYYYRQMDGQETDSSVTQLDRLGDNAAGDRISAFVMDANCTTTGYPYRTNHDQELVCIGYIQGDARKYNTPNEELSLRLNDGPKVFAPHSRLDEILELADSLAQ
ncbi:MAG: type II secretion system protein [Phycisphaerae bacterium]|nr:type II secretion system protein [Phycisphaerae bacterium]